MHIVTTHKNTDFRCPGQRYCRNAAYIPIHVPILPKSLNPNVKAFLSIHKDLLQVSTVDDINLGEITRLVVVDVNRWERLDRMADLKTRDDLEIFLWDHHFNKGNIAADFQCRERTGATVTLLIRQLKKEKKIIGIITRSDAMRYFYDLLPD